MVLIVGTDCSGIDAPIHALKQMDITFEHKFSCEIDKSLWPIIFLNSRPDIIYQNIKERRDHSVALLRAGCPVPKRDPPKINLYVAGFPCQPFSIMNIKRGQKHEKDDIFNYCLNTIKKSSPEIFILENVKGLTQGKMKPVFEKICKDLTDLDEYHVSWKVFNTCDYGIPQNRERIYFVGIKKDKMVKQFEWPSPIKLTTTFHHYLVRDEIIPVKLNDTHNKRIGDRLNHLVSLHALKHTNEKFAKVKTAFKPDICPCITTSNGIYYTKEDRQLTGRELLNLQGFDKTFKIPKAISQTKLRHCAGNTMSVNVLKAIFTEIFKSVDLFTI